ncbi:hypothetical protein [Aquamicrobium soli]|uniref:Uncharacterized protein n=1 Tax=Aquamicrobium soli TaxID=1811518 RepID=A0ABV7KE99_9HYPH
MAKKTTRINESDRYDPYTSRASLMDDAPKGEIPTQPNTLPAEDAVLALNLAKMIAADTLLDGAKADHKAVKQHVEAKGVNLKAHSLASKIVSSGKVAEYIELFSDTLKYLKIRGRPVQTSQLELLVTEDDRTPVDDRAREEGRYAGIMGYPESSNPYSVDSEHGQIWLTAYRGGEDERKLILDLEPAEGSELISGQSDDPFADPEAEAA